MAGKRSKAATSGLGAKKPKRITGKQRRARKVNIEVARRAKKGSSGNSQAKQEKKTRSFYSKLSKYEAKNSFKASTNWHRAAVAKAKSSLYDPNISAAQAMKIVKAM